MILSTYIIKNFIFVTKEKELTILKFEKYYPGSEKRKFHDESK